MATSPSLCRLLALVVALGVAAPVAAQSSSAPRAAYQRLLTKERALSAGGRTPTASQVRQLVEQVPRASLAAIPAAGTPTTRSGRPPSSRECWPHGTPRRTTERQRFDSWICSYASIQPARSCPRRASPRRSSRLPARRRPSRRPPPLLPHQSGRPRRNPRSPPFPRHRRWWAQPRMARRSWPRRRPWRPPRVPPQAPLIWVPTCHRQGQRWSTCAGTCCRNWSASPSSSARRSSIATSG